ncbi:UDP-glucose dehydrogenase family protein [Peribacillus sp. SCS-155]|uniref:UDP-glucose dehydrogenase family protein n=1 Tax=Peribacillus sedimenti TaxID=3115297 RepID=UPI003906BC68
MEICVIGAGYVGLTTAAVLSDRGHTVCCVDTDLDKINLLRRGEVPIYEPGLEELIAKNQENLSFSASPAESVRAASVIFVAVGTPSRPDGSTDLRYILSAVDTIAEATSTYKTIIIKSTVPPGTNEQVYLALLRKGLAPELFDVVSNPEFLKEGSAINDMIHPDKIVIGKQDTDTTSFSVLQQVYKGIDAPIILTSLNGAEMIKYASNAFLATKVSFINEISRICDKYEVNIEDVKDGIGTDPRIGPLFLSSGLGYGGSCFPKDVRSLEHSAQSRDVIPHILQAIQNVNATQIDIYIDKLLEYFEDLTDKNLAVLGIAFKPNTDDTRDSPAVSLIKRLSEHSCRIQVYDPRAKFPHPELKNVTQQETCEHSILNADCVIIATEWDEFVQLDWRQVKEWMKGTYIMDARNCIDAQSVRSTGLSYIGIARP